MAEAIRIGEPEIEIRLRRHPRARRMTLRVAPHEGAAVLTLPVQTPVGRARAFALEQEGWLRGRLAAAPARVRVGPGAALPFRGATLTLAPATDGRASLADGILRLPGPPREAGPRAAAFLREAARQRCLAAAGAHAARLGRSLRRLTLRDTRGRWGSCTASGDLMFSWRLILAPDAVLDYVAAHEAAHLVELNHSPRFWSLVATLEPDFEASRAWLRRHGQSLMSYDFAAA